MCINPLKKVNVALSKYPCIHIIFIKTSKLFLLLVQKAYSHICYKVNSCESVGKCRKNTTGGSNLFDTYVGKVSDREIKW